MLQIFKAGKHTTMFGETIEFSEADVQATAAAYDRRKHEAPLLIGHDESKPNQGLIKACFSQGPNLWAAPHKVAPQFAEDVNAGRYPKLSCRFYRPDESGNPIPGVWYLRHVGTAQIPAVKGMDDPSFSESNETSKPVVINFTPVELAESMPLVDGGAVAGKGVNSSPTSFAESSLGVKLRSLMSDKQVSVAELAKAGGIDESAMGAILSGEINPPEARIRGFAQALGVSADSLMSLIPKPEKEVSMSEQQQQLSARAAELDRREKELNRKSIVQFLEGLVAQGKPLPAPQDEMVAFMEQLPDQPVQFGEGNGQQSPRQWFENVLPKMLDSQVDFSERAPGGDVPPDQLTKARQEAIDKYESHWKETS